MAPITLSRKNNKKRININKLAPKNVFKYKKLKTVQIHAPTKPTAIRQIVKFQQLIIFQFNSSINSKI